MLVFGILTEYRQKETESRETNVDEEHFIIILLLTPDLDCAIYFYVYRLKVELWTNLLVGL